SPVHGSGHRPRADRATNSRGDIPITTMRLLLPALRTPPRHALRLVFLDSLCARGPGRDPVPTGRHRHRDVVRDEVAVPLGASRFGPGEKNRAASWFAARFLLRPSGVFTPSGRGLVAFGGRLGRLLATLLRRLLLLRLRREGLEPHGRLAVARLRLA